MSGNNRQNNQQQQHQSQHRNQSGWNRGPSPIMYRPPSPWTSIAGPSPPPIIAGPRRFSMQSPGPIIAGGSPMSPTPGGVSCVSPSIGGTGLRGTRAGTTPNTNNISYPRPQWPPQNKPIPQQAQYQPQSMFGIPVQQPIQSNYPSPQFRPVTPPNGPKPYRPINSYSPGPTSSFQLSPTPSPIVFQSQPPEYFYSPPVPQLPQPSHLAQQYQQHHRQTPQRQTPQRQTPQRQTPQRQLPQTNYRSYDRPSSRLQQQQQQSFEYVGVPLEPPQPKSYIIYDDEEETGPTTAEIIANQSQDYIDEKLAEYQMTILQLQGEGNGGHTHISLLLS